MEPYLSYGQFLCVLYFLILLLLFPLGIPIERLVYDTYTYEANKLLNKRILSQLFADRNLILFNPSYLKIVILYQKTIIIKK